MKHVRQLPGGCDLISENSHSLILRGQDPLVVSSRSSADTESDIPCVPESLKNSDGALTEQAWIYAGLREPELEVQKQEGSPAWSRPGIPRTLTSP